MSVCASTLVAGLGGRCPWIVRAFIGPGCRTCGHIADRQDHVAGDRLDNRSSDGMSPNQNKRSVKPSAQPTMVRTHHLPPPARTVPDLRPCGSGASRLSPSVTVTGRYRHWVPVTVRPKYAPKLTLASSPGRRCLPGPFGCGEGPHFLPVQAVSVDPQQHGDAVASPLSNALGFGARLEPCGDAGVPQVVWVLRERGGYLGVSECDHAGLRPHPAVRTFGQDAAPQATEQAPV